MKPDFPSYICIYSLVFEADTSKLRMIDVELHMEGIVKKEIVEKVLEVLDDHGWYYGKYFRGGYWTDDWQWDTWMEEHDPEKQQKAIEKSLDQGDEGAVFQLGKKTEDMDDAMSCTVSFHEYGGAVHISCSVSERYFTRDEVDQEVLLGLAEELFEKVDPEIGYVDRSHSIPSPELQYGLPKYIADVTYFSDKKVEIIGRTDLLRSSAAKVKELETGIVLWVCSKPLEGCSMERAESVGKDLDMLRFKEKYYKEEPKRPSEKEEEEQAEVN